MINSLVSLHWAEICPLDNSEIGSRKQRRVGTAAVYNTVHASEVSLAGSGGRTVLSARMEQQTGKAK